MAQVSKTNRYAKIQWMRLGAQVLGITLNIAAAFTLVYTMGLPRWVFLAIVFTTGLFFCGWLCPFGTLQEWLRPLGRKLGLNIKIPKKIDRYLTLFRYFPPFLIAPAVWAVMNVRMTFFRSLTGGIVTGTALVVLSALLLLALAVDRPYCKYLCGYGALLGLRSMVRLLTIKRNQSVCINCGRCDKACSMGVEVSKANNVRDPHCINCGICLGSCVKPGALTIGLALPCKADFVALKQKYFPPKKNTAA